MSPPSSSFLLLFFRQVLSMKLAYFTFYKYVAMSFLLAMLFFNCSRLSISQYCSEDEEGNCEEKQGRSEFLIKKSVDILIVLDNSPLGQKLNPQITANLNQFINCIEPLDWRVGLLSGVENKDSPMGMLLPLEGAEEQTPNLELADTEYPAEQETGTEQERPWHSSGGPEATDTEEPAEQQPAPSSLPSQKIISADMENPEKIFSDTVSLSSGCEHPPFCHKGKRKPLSAVKAFMENTEEKEQFLREESTLTVVVVSSSDEKGGWFSDPDTTAKTALTSLSAEYDPEQLSTFSVTDSGKTDDCIKTAGEVIKKGAGFLGNLGQAIGMITLEPITILASASLTYYAADGESPAQELTQFAEAGGGKTFDICKPYFGRALAYGVLQSVDREGQFPEKCQQFEKKSAGSENGKKNRFKESNHSSEE